MHDLSGENNLFNLYGIVCHSCYFRKFSVSYCDVVPRRCGRHAQHKSGDTVKLFPRRFEPDMCSVGYKPMSAPVLCVRHTQKGKCNAVKTRTNKKSEWGSVASETHI